MPIIFFRIFLLTALLIMVVSVYLQMVPDNLGLNLRNGFITHIKLSYNFFKSQIMLLLPS